MKYLFTLLIISSLFTDSYAQNGPYEINGKVDWPVAIGATGLTIYGYYRIGQLSGADSLEIVNLNYKTDVSEVDRWLDTNYSETANRDSDFIFYGSMALPFAMLTIPEIKKDAGTIGLLYMQALGIPAALYSNISPTVERLRPLAYDEETPFSEKTRSNAKLSFFAGHSAIVATSTFFMAKVLSDYFPNRTGLKWIAYSSASVLTLTTSYLRHRAGKHFLTGLTTGVAVGVLAGILVPELHKKKNKDAALSIRPFGGRVSGLNLTYKIR